MKNEEKKPYQKPQLRRIKLAIEEAVLTGCKILTADVGRTGRLCSSAACRATGVS